MTMLDKVTQAATDLYPMFKDDIDGLQLAVQMKVLGSRQAMEQFINADNLTEEGWEELEDIATITEATINLIKGLNK